MRENKHILFIQPNLYGQGGIENVVPVLARNLNNSNFKVSAISFYKLDNLSFFEFSFSLNETNTRSVLHRLCKVFKRLVFLKNKIKFINPDVIIVSAFGASIIVLFLKYIKLINDTSVLVYVHESSTRYNAIAKKLMNFFYKKADGFICVSKGILKEIERINKSAPLVLAYNPAPKCCKEKVNLIGKGPHFVTASRLEKIKGVDVLVKNFIRYIKDGGKGTLHVLGEGSLRFSLEEYVKKEGLSNNVIFYGEKTNVCAYLVSADAYISCAREEALGVSLLEALSCGKPIIVTDVPYGPREIIGISHNLKVKYPYLNTYGILITHPDDPDFYYIFKSALKKIVKNNVFFDEFVIRRKARYFNEKNQLNKVKKIL